jgi:hypothetical protein
MVTQLGGKVRVGEGTRPVVTLTPQVRRLPEGPVLRTLLHLAIPTAALMLLQGVIAADVFGWGIDSLFALMACGLVLYGMVMVAVMRRELGLSSGGR